jgi:hypothetical protein
MITIKAVKGKGGAVAAWLSDGSPVYWPAHYSNKPDYRFKFVTVNCCRYRLDWVGAAQ